MAYEVVEAEPWLERWGLEADGWPFQTPYTRSLILPVHCRGEAAILKVAGHAEEARGAALMAWWDGDGAAPVLEHAGPAIVLVRSQDPEALQRMAFEGDDDAATTILCEVVAHLHRPHARPPPAELRPLDSWLRALQAARGRHEVYDRAADLALELLASPQDPVVLHGDLTHHNVLDFGDRGWLAIDPKGLFGDRGYDYANIFRSPAIALVTPERFARQVSLVARLAGIERSRVLKWAIVHGAIALAWASEDGHKVGRDAMRYPQMALAELDRA
jgi:streptomycin 6-kinase